MLSDVKEVTATQHGLPSVYVRSRRGAVQSSKTHFLWHDEQFGYRRYHRARCSRREVDVGKNSSVRNGEVLLRAFAKAAQSAVEPLRLPLVRLSPLTIGRSWALPCPLETRSTK